MKWSAFIILFVLPGIINAQYQLLKSRSSHLRDGLKQEWSSFPVKAKDSQLVVRFDSKDISGEHCISITQHDVNHAWKVFLNDQLLGSFVIDEKQMVTYFTLPHGILKKRNNILIVRPESMKSSQPDDILIGKIILYKSSIKELLTESSLNIHVGLPSRLTIINRDNSLQPVHTTPGDTMAVRSGMIYSGSGNFSFSLPAGKYKVYASRGFEYGVDSAIIDIRAGEKISSHFSLVHEVDLQNWRSCDTHVHTQEYSGHGDASMKERILTIAGEGLDYAVITEHNKIVNIRDSVGKMGMQKWFTPVNGNELTTKVGHFNIFPADDAPSPDVKNWENVKQIVAGSPGKKVVILNHARDIHNDFRPADLFPEMKTGQIPANAMEIMNSGSQQTDPRELYLDWLGLIRRGIVLTPVGSSDSHDVTRFIVGQARTYVRSDGDFVTSFLEGRVGVSFGLFTELITDTTVSGNKINVSIRVYAPSWVKPAKITLYANGEQIYTSGISLKDKKGNVYIKTTGIDRPSRKMILVAVAEGPDPKVPWWPVAKPYQHTSPEVKPIVLGLTGAVIIQP